VVGVGGLTIPGRGSEGIRDRYAGLRNNQESVLSALQAMVINPDVNIPLVPTRQRDRAEEKRRREERLAVQKGKRPKTTQDGREEDKKIKEEKTSI
jgi:hypothetical protein